jgi:thioesterase domain-containing protein
MSLEDLSVMSEAFKLNSKLMEQYQGGSYDGLVTLFRAELDPVSSRGGDGQAFPREPQGGWEKLAAGVQVIPVPGDHFSMIRDPHVKILARELLACIAAAASTKSLTAAF